MNLVHTTADVLGSLFIGPTYTFGKPLLLGAATGTLRESATNLAINSVIFPLVRQGLERLPPVRQALQASAQLIGTGTKKVTEWSISRSVKNAIHKEIKNTPERESEKRLSSAAIEVLNPLAISPSGNVVGRFAAGIGTSAISQTASLQLGCLLTKIPAPPILASLYPTLLVNGILGAQQLGQTQISQETREQLKEQLAAQLLKGVRAPELSRAQLKTIFGKVAQAIVEHPAVNLPVLEEKLKEANETFFSKLVDQILAFFKSVKDSLFGTRPAR